MLEIRSCLCGDATELDAELGAELRAGGDVVLLFTLGIDGAALQDVARAIPAPTPVVLVETYGILGWSARARRNLELMEKNRGQEYGGPGGDGGTGVVAVVFRGGVVAGPAALPRDASAHLVIAGGGGSIDAFLSAGPSGPYFGGVAKSTHLWSRSRDTFERTPLACISFREPTGTTSFTARPGEALGQLLASVPAGREVTTVALFPCFMRGKNEYGTNDVEPAAVSELLPAARVYGMFCHGELGPTGCLGFAPPAGATARCTQHSMTTIVAMHLR